MGQWQSQEVCTTPACIHASSLVLKGMAPNWREMDPCTEFDKMVCYGAEEHNGIDGSTMYSVATRNNNILRKILESADHAEAARVKSTMLNKRSNADEANFDMLRTAYQACMDEDKLDGIGLKPITELLVTFNKTWPVTPADKDEKLTTADFDGLHKVMLLGEEMGTPIFHGYCSETGPVMSDYLDSKTNRICYGTPSLTMASNLTAYTDPKAMEKYTALVGTVLNSSLPDLELTEAMALGKAVVDFEVAFVEIARKYVPKDAPFHQLLRKFKHLPLSDVAETLPMFGFEKLVKALTPKGKTPDSIIVAMPDLWRDWSETIMANHTKGTVQGFAMWQTARAFLPHIRDETLTELLKMGNRVPICIQSADDLMRHILDSYFVKATYPELAFKAADKMTTNIKAQVVKHLTESDWMSADSKKRAVNKAERIVQDIGYPTKQSPDLHSAQSLQSYYAGLNITSSHFDNILSGYRVKVAKAYAEVASPPNRHSMGDIKMVNAFYSPMNNKIAIPAGISQLPIFHHHLPNYVMYGSLGVVVGHEFAHAFDNNGREWNEDGELKEWWDQSTVDAFDKRAQCFVDQYSQFSFPVPGGTEHVNGTRTLGENLADAGGLRAAYDAWALERAAMPAAWDQSLPGLEDFTHEQLFFLFYAHLWCDSPAPKTMRDDILPGVHSPPRARIKGGLDNSAAFKEAFKCKVREPKCTMY